MEQKASGTYIALLLCAAKSKGYYFGNLYSPPGWGLLILLANYVAAEVGNLTHHFLVSLSTTSFPGLFNAEISMVKSPGSEVALSKLP